MTLPKTPSARRRKVTAAKRSRTLRSTAAARLSVDSGLGLDMRQKSLARLDIVMEKDTEEPACTVVKFTDTQPAAAGPDEEDKQTVEENKENIGAQQTSADDKERDVDEKVCEKDEHKHTPRTSTCLTSPNNIVDTQVLYHYVIVIFVFFVFIM